MCFVWISEQTAIISLYSINWLVFITETECVYWAVQTEAIHYIPPGLTFTNSTFCPHTVFMCFVWISEQTAIISLCSINWLVFITEKECVYWAVQTEAIHYVPPGLTFTNSVFCPHTVFMCFVWISERTAIISLYYINWLVFITETECVYRAVQTEAIRYVLPGLTFMNSMFCPPNVFMCLYRSQNKQRLYPYTPVTYWFHNRDGECLLCGMDWNFIRNSDVFKAQWSLYVPPV